MAVATDNFDHLFFDSTKSGTGKDGFDFCLEVDWMDCRASETKGQSTSTAVNAESSATRTLSKCQKFRPPACDIPASQTGLPELPCLSQQKAGNLQWTVVPSVALPHQHSGRSPQVRVVAPSKQLWQQHLMSLQRSERLSFQQQYSHIGVASPESKHFMHSQTPQQREWASQAPQDIPQTPLHSTSPPSPYDDEFQFSSQHRDRLQTPQALSIQGITPGGSARGTMHLRPVTEIPKAYRKVFSFPYFNNIQSKVFDDVFYSDCPLVLCAPTGSGKTVVFELAIIRLLLHQYRTSKVVYMAPIKALCSERYQDWLVRFGSLGLRCLELTGDTQLDDYFDLQDAHIIFTTPEKWDSMTRHWRDNRSLVETVKVFLIDEVHMVNDESRGATMEAVVSRMKTVQSALAQGANTNTVRFIAVSATIPNVEDVAEWLSTGRQKPAFYNMDDSYRPVQLRKVVLGYPCSENYSEFRFDLSLNYKLSSTINKYSDGKPTLVFCATRKSTMQAAATLAKDTKFMRTLDAQHRQQLQLKANMLKDAKLRELLRAGIGYHHAGLDAQDRKTVADIFAQGDLCVLMATSTLAMGVNLPSHLVIIKSTQHYVMGMYQEYSETQILQMIGRAGRPQFDSTATAVIMTRNSTKARYEALLNGTQVIESSLHRHLVEHLMAEIVLNTITDVAVALDWLKSTFLYIRVMKNPAYYGIPPGSSTDRVEKKLQEMCLKDLNSLASIDLLRMDEECFALKATDTGRLMARYCVAFDTMKNFHELSGTEVLNELLTVLCKSQEFSDIQLRTNEKRILNTLNKDKHRPTIRFPMQGKIKTSEMKVSCLIQTQLGCLPLQDFALQQDTNKIFRASNRIAKCLMEMTWHKEEFKAMLNAVILLKCLRAKLWENSRHVSRQLTGIGVALANSLVNAGICTFQKIEQTNPRNLELVVNRHPPFGNQVRDAVCHLPKYQVCIDQSTAYASHTAELMVMVNLCNKEVLMEKTTADHHHTCILLIGDTDNTVVCKARISDAVLLKAAWSKKLTVRRASRGEELSVNYISQDWVGLDVQSTFTPVYMGSKHLSLTRTGTQVQSGQYTLQAESHTCSRGLVLEEGSVSQPRSAPGGDHRACSHHCTNKASCGHECYKAGIMTKRDQAMTGSVASCKKGLKHKLQYMPQTPQVKIKRAQGTTPRICDLQKYAYTPRRGERLAARNTPVPTTPSGWGALELYEQRRQTADCWQTSVQEDGVQGPIKTGKEHWLETSSMALVTDHNGDFQLLEASQQQLDHQAHYKTAERSTHCNGPRSGQRAQPLPGTWDDEDSLPDIASPGSSGTEAEWLAKESGDGFCEQTAAAEAKAAWSQGPLCNTQQVTYPRPLLSMSVRTCTAPTSNQPLDTTWLTDSEKEEQQHTEQEDWIPEMAAPTCHFPGGRKAGHMTQEDCCGGSEDVQPLLGNQSWCVADPSTNDPDTDEEFETDAMHASRLLQGFFRPYKEVRLQTQGVTRCSVHPNWQALSKMGGGPTAGYSRTGSKAQPRSCGFPESTLVEKWNPDELGPDYNDTGSGHDTKLHGEQGSFHGAESGQRAADNNPVASSDGELSDSALTSLNLDFCLAQPTN